MTGFRDSCRARVLQASPVPMGYTSPMHESLAGFLKTFSSQSPFLWAFLVMAVIAVTGLVLYGFWEIVLRGVSLVFSGGSRKGSNDSAAHGGH